MKKIVITLMSVCTLAVAANASIRLEEPPKQEYGKTTIGKECREAGVTVSRNNNNYYEVKVETPENTSANVYIDHKNGNITNVDTRNTISRQWRANKTDDVDVQCQTQNNKQ